MPIYNITMENRKYFFNIYRLIVLRDTLDKSRTLEYVIYLLTLVFTKFARLVSTNLLA